MNTIKLHLKKFRAKAPEPVGIEPIDLSVPIDDDNARMNEAFRWATESLLSRKIVMNDPRRVDFEHILDCLFLMKKNPSFNRENIHLLLSKYFDLWYNVWCKKEQNPNVLILFDRICLNQGTLIRFIPEDKLGPGESISEYLVKHSGGIAIFDHSLCGIHSYGETYMNQKGYILMAAPFYSDLNPISIIYSLSIITATGMAWNEVKITEALKWCSITEPALYFNREDMYTVVRYDPADQEGRIKARPPENGL